MEYHKTPFRKQEFVGKHVIIDKANRIVAEMWDQDQERRVEDTAYILQACNQYPILIDLLQRVQHTLAPETIYYKLISQTINR